MIISFSILMDLVEMESSTFTEPSLTLSMSLRLPLISAIHSFVTINNTDIISSRKASDYLYIDSLTHLDLYIRNECNAILPIDEQDVPAIRIFLCDDFNYCELVSSRTELDLEGAGDHIRISAQFVTVCVEYLFIVDWYVHSSGRSQTGRALLQLDWSSGHHLSDVNVIVSFMCHVAANR